MRIGFHANNLHLGSNRLDRVTIIEPQCVEHEHASFNAALLASLFLVYPGRRFVFWGERSHVDILKNTLLRSRVDTKNIEFHSIHIPRFVLGNHPWKLVRVAKRIGALAATLFHLARVLLVDTSRGETLWFTSVARESLMALKCLSPVSRKLEVYCVLHSALNVLNARSPKGLSRSWDFATWLGRVTAPNISYVVLSADIKDRTLRALPGMQGRLGYVDLPILGIEIERETARTAPKGKELVFGFFGVGTREKGIHHFFDLAKKSQEWVHTERTRIKSRFVHIGALLDPQLLKDRPGIKYVEGAEDRFLGREVFERKAGDIDYAVFPYDFDSCEFVASAAILDAISFGIPVIATDTAYFRYCFDNLGPIGYLCGSLDEMQQTIMNLTSGVERIDCGRIQAALSQAREFFSVQRVAQQIRRLLEEAAGRHSSNVS